MQFIDEMLKSEKKLENWIETNPHIVFGEEINWVDSHVRADLVGKDSEGNAVLVEVKLWSENDPNRRGQEYSCVGQIIRYANDYINAYPSENMRLFIVAEIKSEVVECCCEFLRSYNINIKHISVMDAIQNALERELARRKQAHKDADGEE